MQLAESRMDAVSRESYAPALAKVNEFAKGGGPRGQSVQATPETVAAVADEILAVAALLAREHGLRRALADPSRSGEDRAALLDAVLAGKVSADAAALVRVLAAGRWSSGADLLNVTERLGVQALLASAEAAGELAEVEDELFRFGQVVDGDLRLASALGASTVPAQQRVELARMLLRGKARAVTIRLVEVALHGFGGRGFAAALTRLVELAAHRRQRDIAYVTVAAPVTEAELSRLAARLEQIYGRAVDVKVTVDPAVLGGMSVRVGDDLYDGSVRRRLVETRAALAGNK